MTCQLCAGEAVGDWTYRHCVGNKKVTLQQQLSRSELRKEVGGNSIAIGKRSSRSRA